MKRGVGGGGGSPKKKSKMGEVGLITGFWFFTNFQPTVKN